MEHQVISLTENDYLRGESFLARRDDSFAPIGGGYVFQTNLFSDLDVSFDMFSFDESRANSGWLQFDSSGGLLEAHFGTNCSAFGCGVSGLSYSWWIRVGLASSENDFTYGGYKGATSVYQTFNNRLISIPEPGIIALLGLGLAGLAATRRRKQ